jgi:hypothetical protein
VTTPVKVPNLRALPAVNAEAAALAAGEARHSRLHGQLTDTERRITEALARAALPGENPRARFEASAASLLSGKADLEHAASDQRAEERRKDLQALHRTRALLEEAIRQSERLLDRERDAFSLAACAALAGPYRELLRAKIRAAIEFALADLADLAFREELTTQDVGLGALPSLLAPWLGDLRAYGTGPIHNLLIEALEAGVIDAGELPPQVAAFTRGKGLELRAERESSLRPRKKAVA